MNNDDREKNEKSGGASPNQHAPSGDRLAPVITLHHHDQHTDDTPEVVEGEIVDPTCGPQVEDPAPGTPGTDVVVSRRDIYRSDLHAAGRGALAVATHPVTVGGTKALVRNTWFVFSGAGVLVQRWRDTGAGEHEPRVADQGLRSADGDGVGGDGEGASACGVQVGAVDVAPRHHHVGSRCPGRGVFHLRSAGRVDDLAFDDLGGVVGVLVVVVQGDDRRQSVP
ncbi:hypothetical protein [Pseudonocardia sp. ICBG601]|uniref:hypothetical protein n=1 Tax=Pseudonocardia sp. ICBG601 TaxID=2846759 RepID=UPI001CF66106|nr:hypothetical protein [Pseudonocardia sp. ICBG601]